MVQRGLKNANFRYRASIEQIDYSDGRGLDKNCLLYTSPSPRDRTRSRMPSSAFKKKKKITKNNKKILQTIHELRYHTKKNEKPES